MVVDSSSSYYEEEYLDSDDTNFHKLSQKAKVARHDKKAAVKAKRKEKMRQQASEQREYFLV